MRGGGPGWAAASAAPAGTTACSSADVSENDAPASTRAGESTLGGIGALTAVSGSVCADGAETPVAAATAADPSKARKAFAGQLAEALCSRAQRVAGRRGCRSASPVVATSLTAPLPASSGAAKDAAAPLSSIHEEEQDEHVTPSYAAMVAGDTEKSGSQSQKARRAPGRRGSACAETSLGCESAAAAEAPAGIDEVPFARRAALAGRVFRGGKCDGTFLLNIFGDLGKNLG